MNFTLSFRDDAYAVGTQGVRIISLEGALLVNLTGDRMAASAEVRDLRIDVGTGTVRLTAAELDTWAGIKLAAGHGRSAA